MTNTDPRVTADRHDGADKPDDREMAQGMGVWILWAAVIWTLGAILGIIGIALYALFT